MIIAIILLLFTSLFFSGSETALTAVNKVKLQSKAQNGDMRAQKLLDLVSNPSQFITTILIGNNIANILLPTLVTALAIEYGISLAIASAMLTIIIIIFAEVIPKSIAAQFSEAIAYKVAPIIRFFMVIFKPIVVVLNVLTDALARVLSRGEVEETLSKEELRAIVDIAGSEGSLHKDESYRISAALNFNNLDVKDVMTTPRTEIEGVHIDDDYETVRDFVIDQLYTRYPVYDQDLDDIIGVFHSKYLLTWSVQPDKTVLDFSDRSPLTVHEFESVESVLRRMTKEHKHLAIVIDEFGGTEGILTHEDIIEALLGFEIEDETDLQNDALIESVNEKEMVCEGKMTLHRLNSVFGSELPEDEDTLSGYLYKGFNDFPEVGDTYMNDGIKFTVIQMENHRIRKVRLEKTT